MNVDAAPPAGPTVNVRGLGRVQRFVLAELASGGRLFAVELAERLNPARPVPLATLESVRRAIRQLTRQGLIESGPIFKHGIFRDGPYRPGREALACWLPGWAPEPVERYHGPPAPLAWPAHLDGDRLEQ